MIDILSDSPAQGNGNTYSHAQQPSRVVLKREVLIRKGLGAVDGRAARAVAVEEIATLDHEVSDLRIEDDCLGCACLLARVASEVPLSQND